MFIITDGYLFSCSRCGVEGKANVASDFYSDEFGQYSITCPNCGEKHPVQPEDIPPHILRNIKRGVTPIMKFHD